MAEDCGKERAIDLLFSSRLLFSSCLIPPPFQPLSGRRDILDDMGGSSRDTLWKECEGKGEKKYLDNAKRGQSSLQGNYTPVRKLK